LTFRTVDVAPSRPNWHPGQEPGLDPTKLNGGRPQTPNLHEECQITVVDFSEDNIDVHDFDNAGLIAFIARPQESWIKCRWINVNGLSWDVIQALGQQKKLHRLAIEDLTNTDNRTKADW
jgi:Mg2+ and Co2+ transporter CorA